MILKDPPAQHQLLHSLQRFQFPAFHQVDRDGVIVGDIRIGSDGQPLPPQNSGPAILTIDGGFIQCGNAPVPIKPTDFYCASVQIQSIRQNFESNEGLIGIGNATAPFMFIDLLGVQLIKAPDNGLINLKNIYIYAQVPDDQIHYALSNSI